LVTVFSRNWFGTQRGATSGPCLLGCVRLRANHTMPSSHLCVRHFKRNIVHLCVRHFHQAFALRVARPRSLRLLGLVDRSSFLGRSRGRGLSGGRLPRFRRFLGRPTEYFFALQKNVMLARPCAAAAASVFGSFLKGGIVWRLFAHGSLI